MAEAAKRPTVTYVPEKHTVHVPLWLRYLHAGEISTLAHRFVYVPGQPLHATYCGIDVKALGVVNLLHQLDNRAQKCLVCELNESMQATQAGLALMLRRLEFDRCADCAWREVPDADPAPTEPEVL